MQKRRRRKEKSYFICSQGRAFCYQIPRFFLILRHDRFLFPFLAAHPNRGWPKNSNGLTGEKIRGWSTRRILPLISFSSKATRRHHFNATFHFRHGSKSFLYGHSSSGNTGIIRDVWDYIISDIELILITRRLIEHNKS